MTSKFSLTSIVLDSQIYEEFIYTNVIILSLLLRNAIFLSKILYGLKVIFEDKDLLKESIPFKRR